MSQISHLEIKPLPSKYRITKNTWNHPIGRIGWPWVTPFQLFCAKCPESMTSRGRMCLWDFLSFLVSLCWNDNLPQIKVLHLKVCTYK
jgi:hypothetical protein